MNWYIGQNIVAIVDHSKGKFKDGDSFVIKSLLEGVCNCPNKKILIDVGLVANGGKSKCITCNVVVSGCWFADSCFAPLDELCNISELTEILTETKPFEV